MFSKPAEQGGLVILEELGSAGVPFEIAVGRNGKVWVDSKSVKTTLGIGRAIQDTDNKGLNVEEQKKLAKRWLGKFPEGKSYPLGGVGGLVALPGV